MKFTKVSKLVTANTYPSSIERASKRLTEAPICLPPSGWLAWSLQSGPATQLTLISEKKINRFVNNFVVCKLLYVSKK